MKNELIIKKCQKCGALVEVINDCNCWDCGITCCGEPMVKLISNSVDASFENIFQLLNMLMMKYL